MRVALTNSELETDVGKQLLELCRPITADGVLDLQEIITLRKWLRANQGNDSVAAVPYLHDIMSRVTADGVIDRDEQLELHLAIERVIPPAFRTSATQARKKREAERRERKREQQRIEKEREKEERKRLREEEYARAVQQRQEEYARAMRIRHDFAKVAGVTFPNDDGTERQQIICQCVAGEHLLLRHDPNNAFSEFATKVLRLNGEQLGHAPEYLAEQIVEAVNEGYFVMGVLANVTGGTFDKPTRGVNFAVFYFDKNVPNEELTAYMNQVMANRT